jgi:hypothetical protein
MKIHHDKHHAAYVNNANKALAGHPDLAKMDVYQLVAHLDEVPDDIRTALRNNAGGHANHSLFWLMMKPGGGGQPSGELAAALDEAFGNFGDFKNRVVAQSGQSHDERRQTAARPRRLGARLLSQKPEPPHRLRRCMVERGQLGLRGGAIQGSRAGALIPRASP